MDENPAPPPNTPGEPPAGGSTPLPPIVPAADQTPTSPDTPPLSISTDRPPRPPSPIFIVIVFLLVILGSGGFGTYAIAYEKINIGNPSLQHAIGDFILGLPFAPKTPRYLLAKALIAQKNISKHSVDVSLATSLSGLTTPLGLNSLDANLKGAVDYSDPKNPRLSLSLSVTKDFNADVRKNDSLIYFKINKLPMALLTPFLNLTASDSANVEKFLENWVSYDTTPLQTEARKVLEKEGQSTSYTNELIQKSVDNFLDDQILKAITVSEDKDGNVPVYKLSLKGDDKLVDHLGEKAKESAKNVSKGLADQKTKLSSHVKDLEIGMFIQKDDYYVRQLSISFKSKTPSLPLPGNGLEALSTVAADQSKETPVAIVVKMSDFGKDVDVETPAQSISVERYLQMFQEGIGSLRTRQQLAKDAKRKSDIEMLRSALEMCQADSKDMKYVAKLDDLVACKTTAKVPTDPDTGQNYVYTPGPTRTAYTLKATLSDGTVYSKSETK